MPRRMAASVVAFVVLTVAPQAVQLTLDPRAIEEAIAIGQSRLAAERTRFHEPYRLIVNKPPVDYIDVVTPFRRIVLTAQGRAEIGDRGFGQRQALEALAAAPDELDLQFELTFHPLNTFIGIPDYAVTFLPALQASAAGQRGVPAVAPIQPRSIERVPRFGARVEGMPLPAPASAGPVTTGRTQPMLGGTVIARFDGRVLMPDTLHTVVIREGDRELARLDVDLGRLR